MTLNFESDFFFPRIFCLVLAGLGATLSSTEGRLYILLYISLQLGFHSSRLPQSGSVPGTSSIQKAFCQLGITH